MFLDFRHYIVVLVWNWAAKLGSIYYLSSLQLHLKKSKLRYRKNPKGMPNDASISIRNPLGYYACKHTAVLLQQFYMELEIEISLVHNSPSIVSEIAKLPYSGRQFNFLWDYVKFSLVKLSREKRLTKCKILRNGWKSCRNRKERETFIYMLWFAKRKSIYRWKFKIVCKRK